MSKCNSTTTGKKIIKVFEMLKPYLPDAYKQIQIGFVVTVHSEYDTRKGGYATLSTINIGEEYCNNYKDNPIAIAEMLGHELGHHIMGHIHVGINRQVTPNEEQDADHFGMYICELAGFDRKDYIAHCKDFECWRKSTISIKHIEEHGTSNQRIERLELQDKYLTNIANF